jgi:hypothetical protein
MRVIALLLIAGLGAPDFTVRDWCQSALELSPESAGPFLWHDTTDPEVNWRLRRLRGLYEPAWLVGEWRLATGGEGLWLVRLGRGGVGASSALLSPGSQYPLRWTYSPRRLTLIYPYVVETYHLTRGKVPDSSPLSCLSAYVWSRPGRSFHTRLQCSGHE